MTKDDLERACREFEEEHGVDAFLDALAAIMQTRMALRGLDLSFFDDDQPLPEAARLDEGLFAPPLSETCTHYRSSLTSASANRSVVNSAPEASRTSIRLPEISIPLCGVGNRLADVGEGLVPRLRDVIMLGAGLGDHVVKVSRH